ERGWLLDLCHDAGAFFDEALRLNDVHRTLNKRQCNPIDAERQSEREVGAILFSQRRQWKIRIWQIHPLAVAEHASDEHACLEIVVAALRHLESQFSIVNHQ